MPPQKLLALLMVNLLRDDEVTEKAAESDPAQAVATITTRWKAEVTMNNFKLGELNWYAVQLA